MNWQTLVLLNALLIGLSIILTRGLARQKKHAQVSFAMNALQYVGLYASGLLFLPWLGHVDTGAFIHFFWRFLGGGMVFMLTNVATYKMLTYTDAATGSVLNTLNTLFTVILASLAINENLSAQQAIGAALLTLAIIYGLLTLRSRAHRRQPWLALLYAVIAGVTYSIAIVNEKSLLGHMSAGSYVVFGWGGQFLASIAIAVLLQRKAFKPLFDMATLRLITFVGLLRGVGGVCFVLAQVRSDNVALVTVISSSRLLVVVVLGAFLLKERQKLAQKFAAACAAIAGLGVMFWK